jgi:hypothetical protein
MEALNISEDDLLGRKDLEQLVEQYSVFPDPIPGEAVFQDDDVQVKALERNFAALADNQFLDLGGELIPDWRGTEYHLKVDDTWTVVKITEAGVSIPEGAIISGDLTDDQRAEIAAQAETARIAALTPEARAAEKQDRLDALADEADHLSRRAQIQGTDFNAATWYQEHKAPIEEKYAS